VTVAFEDKLCEQLEVGLVRDEDDRAHRPTSIMP
jgi:hypothetical protein